jgi:PAS domain S-box-containing protein
MAAVMNTVVDGLITIDEQGTIGSFNPGAERIFGYTEAEAIGQNVKFLMPEPYHGVHDQHLHRYKETGVKSIIGVGREVSAKRKDGSVFPLDLAVGEMFLHDRRMYVGILRDITARKEVENDRLKLIENLKQSNQELDDFAYIASHDLKEPLRGLFNNSQFLKEDYADLVDEAGVRRLDRIFFLCKRMERLIDDLLYFSRLGRQDLAYRKTDLNVVVHDILEQLESASGQPGVTVRITEPLPVLLCDATRIGEVFRNLITNALKYNDKAEKIVEIGCLSQHQGKPNVLYVRDNGIGIPAEFHRDVFTIFKRLRPEDDQVRGSGVGLTFARKIVERHGGHIWIDSEVGKGTTFLFTVAPPVAIHNKETEEEKGAEV